MPNTPQKIKNATAQFFDPCLTLWWRGRGPHGVVGMLNDYFYPDGYKDARLLHDFMQEAGLFYATRRCAVDQIDKVMAVAGQYGYSIETRNFEECKTMNSSKEPNVKSKQRSKKV